MNIKILWIDDEWKTQEDFIGEAEQEGMDITPVESHEEGMETLNGKEDFFDAVILDAKVKDEKDAKVTNTVGLKNSRDRLIEINQHHYLPSFIFTGQPDYIDNELFKESYGDFYLKGEGNEKLFTHIKEAVKAKPERKYRLKYKAAFDCFDLGILNNTSKKLLLETLLNHDNQDYRKKNINVQRDLLESIFHSLNNPIPCIPNQFFPYERPNHESCARFLENRPTNNNKRRTDSDFFEDTLKHKIPQEIKSAFRKLKESTNGLSHLQPNDEAMYPFLSNTFLFLEILEWLPKFIKKHYPNYI